MVLRELHRLISKELCSESFGPILREKSWAAFQGFTWESLWLELVEKAPIFLTFAIGCVPMKKAELGISEMAKPVLCMCAAMLLKFRNPKMSLVQRIISLIVDAGHCGTQVRSRMLNCDGMVGTICFHTSISGQ